MGQTPDELRARADYQRAELSRDLEAIGDRISPGRMIERRRASMRQRFSRAREAVMGTADSATDHVRSGVDEARSRVGEAVSATGDRLGEAPDAIRRQTEGNPLAAGLIAFGTGLVLASVIPSSRREEEAARRIQPQLAQVADEVRGTVQQAAEDLKPAARQAVDEVKESAKDAAQTVKDDASERAGHVGDEASQAAQTVRDEASGTQPASPATDEQPQWAQPPPAGSTYPAAPGS